MKRTDIKELVDGWEQKGLVTAEQADRMLADANQYVGERSSMKLINVISTVGALTLALGFLLLIAANWSTFARETKLVFALLLPIVPLCVAYWALVVRSSKRMAFRAANIVGIILIGGALSLIGQMYNLEPNMLNLFGIWTLLSIPFLFVFEKEENVALSLILFGFAIFAGFVELFGNRYQYEELIFVIMTIVYLLYTYLVYRGGAALREHAVWKGSARMMRLLAGAVSTFILFLTTFMFYAELITSAFYWPATAEVPISIALNLLFIGFLFFVLVRAYQHDEEGAGTMVIRWFGIYLIAKYITLFNDMFDTGLLFVVGGILLVAGGWVLENKRGELAGYLKKKFVHTRHEPTRAFTEPERDASERDTQNPSQ